MKILAIRGENIASLCEPFDVNLSEGPLGDAGLFAISGPTGSGKSTLLDTICLALFDTTPRLSERGGASVGRADVDPSHRLAANDVRGLLSRGAAAGFAEVEFKGVDNRRYRARWDVRRSRNKAGGKLQKQSMSLRDVETQRQYGDKKTEVLAAIEHRLGLTFEQFKRSAMLAQGDFAAFLHADDRHRADLLERVTGTEVYSRISRASYERTATERKTYEALVTQAERLGRLTPEQRTELLAQLDITQAALTAADGDHALSKKTLTWFDEHAVLQKRIASAVEALQASQTAVIQAQSRRTHLERIQAMAAIRLPLSRRNDTVRQLSDSVAAETTATAAHRLAQLAVKQTSSAVEQAAAQRKTVVHANSELQPIIVNARALDARIDDARKAEQQSKARVDSAQAAASMTAATVTSLTRALTQTEEQAAAGRAWTAANPHASRLASVIEPVQRALTTLVSTHRRLAEQAQAHPALVAADSQARHVQADARAAELSLAATTSRHHASLHSARIAISEDARPNLDARQRDIDAERERLMRLTTARNAALSADGERTAVTQEVAAVDRSIQADKAALATTTPLHAAAAARLAEAERSLDGLRAARSTAQLRAGLTPGDPCVVCGSSDHPWATNDVVDGLHDAANKRVLALKQDLATHTTTLSEIQARLTTAAQQKTHLAKRALAADTALEDARGAWQHSASNTELPTDPLKAEHALAAIGAQTASAVDSLRQQAEQLNALEGVLRAAQLAYDTAVAEQNAAKAVLEVANEQSRSTAQAVLDSTSEHAAATEAAQTALQTISDALGDRTDWQEQARANPTDLLARLNTEAATFTAHHTTLAQADARLSELRPKQAEAAATAKAASDDHAQQQALHTTAAAHLRDLERNRGSLLNGESVITVVERQREQLARAEERYKAAEEAHQAAITAASSAHGALASTTQQRTNAETSAQLAQKVLNTALLAANVDEPTAVSLLAHTEDWVAGETRDLAALDRAVQTSQTVLTERQAAEQAHQHAAPLGTRQEAEQAAVETKRVLQAAQQAHGDHAAALRRDDTARQQGEELDDQLTEQHAVVERWAAISDVIGSADGKLFRTFAQGLTLDALLVYANHHLTDLAPRYRLQRVPQQDLALQVIDQDMGDEVRAIPSLSGGETFLTSLALALGLSSLAASETPVESLFIDEGFGTLDRDTLDVALAALDSLQATGRQVGLISHVDGLSEHIGVAIHVQKLGAGKSRIVLPVSVATP